MALCASAPAQSLARPGWAGSGLAPESWYRHAVFYRIDAAPLPTLAQLPSLQAFGIDAILLTPEAVVAPPLPANQAPPAESSNQPLSLDDLFFECSRLHIRVLVPLDLAAPDADPAKTLALARSWIFRGAAGFVLTGLDKLAPQPAASTATPLSLNAAPHAHQAVRAIHLAPASPDPQILTELRKLLAQSNGTRILVSATPSNSAALQLQIVHLAAAPDPARLAMLSTQPGPRPLLALENTGVLTPLDAARLLGTNDPAILDSSAVSPAALLHVFPPLSKPVVPEPAAPAAPPPPSNVYGVYVPFVQKDTAAERRKKAAEEKAAAEASAIEADTFPVQPLYQPISETPEGYVAFYHRLVQLHRANATLRDGSVHAVDAAGPAFAWAVTRSGVNPLLFVYNTSATQQTIDLGKALRGIATSSERLRTLLHTAAASGVVDPAQITVGPRGVYVGELARGYVYR